MGIFSKRQKPVASKSYAAYELMPQVSFVPKWNAYDTQRAIRDGYKRSTWVYACVRLRAANAAQVPWIVERETPEGWVEAENHQLQAILKRPNPAYDWSEMVRRFVYSLDLTGDAWATKTRGGGAGVTGAVREIWPILPEHVDIIPGRNAMIRAYKYRRSNISTEIPAEDMLHLRYANPGDMYYGLSPLSAAARAVDIDEEAEKWQKVTLQNMAVPPGALLLEGDVGQEEYEQTKRWVSEQRGADHAREMWVLANAKYQSMAQSATDLDFMEGRKMSREEICAAFSVPLPLVGIYDKATLSNIETAREIFWREGLIPVLDEIQGQLNLQLAQEYEGIRLRYDLSNVEALAENLTEKVNNARTLWSMGVPLDAINQRLELGLDTADMPGADVGYLPGGLLPTNFDVGDSEPGGNAAAQAAGVDG